MKVRRVLAPAIFNRTIRFGGCKHPPYECLQSPTPSPSLERASAQPPRRPFGPVFGRLLLISSRMPICACRHDDANRPLPRRTSRLASKFGASRVDVHRRTRKSSGACRPNGVGRAAVGQHGRRAHPRPLAVGTRADSRGGWPLVSRNAILGRRIAAGWLMAGEDLSRRKRQRSEVVGTEWESGRWGEGETQK